jgi:hypothetical protein
MNVGASGNSAAINRLVDGIAAALRGHRPDALTGSVWTTLSRLTVIVPLLVAILWAAWSYRSLRRWPYRREPPPRGLTRFWRLYLPLVVDLGSVGVMWILLPAIVHMPMSAIALFAPDAFAVVVMITGLAMGCAIARTFVALRPRRVTLGFHRDLNVIVPGESGRSGELGSVGAKGRIAR